MIKTCSPHKRIYFLKPIGMDGPIKVGCSRMTEERLATFTNWSPFPLEIICEVEGGHEVERALHRRYKDTRSHSEWFAPSELMLSDIWRIKNGEPASAIVGDEAEIERHKRALWKWERTMPSIRGEKPILQQLSIHGETPIQ